MTPRSWLIRPRVSLHRDQLELVGFPTGLLYLVTAARQAGFPDPTVVDLRLSRTSDGDLQDRIRRERPNFVGITSFHFEGREAKRLARLVREAHPECLLVVGGPYASMDAEHALAESAFDAAVIGEGEHTFPALLAAARDGESFRNVPGIAYRENGAIVRTPSAEPTDLRTYPVPAWDIMNLPAYFGRRHLHYLAYHERSAPVITSRGCPYHCIYCHCQFGHVLRTRTPESVLAEMDLLYHEYGVRDFSIEDDNFNEDRDHFDAVCAGILERRWDARISIPNGLRYDTLTAEQLRTLKAIGTYHICVPIETGSARMQKVIGKRADLDRIRENIRLTDELGILTVGFIMMDLPTETEAEVRESVRFAVGSRLHFLTCFFAQPFPGTQLFTWANDHDKLRGFDRHAIGFHEFVHGLSEIPPRTLTKLKRWAYQRMYLNPWRLWRIMRLVPNRLYLFRLMLLLAKRAT